MYIRRAKETDLDGLNRLLHQVNMVHYLGRPDLFKPGKKYRDEELIDIIHNDQAPIFVAVDEKEYMLGYCFCIYKQFINDNLLTDIKTLYIDDLCVDEERRGQHVGKTLFEHVKTFAKENGFYNLTLNVWSLNPSAMKFYEACGLQPQKIGMETIL